MGSKRRRNSNATRSAILEAATRRFACRGYKHSGVREIAADAGVTAALVNRYFGSKEGLFSEVMERAFDPGGLLEGPLPTIATSLARFLVYGNEDDPDEGKTSLLLLLRSATEPLAVELLRTNLEREYLKPLAERIGGPDAEARAGMILAQLTGFAILDQMIRPRAFADSDRERLVLLLSESLATYFR